ncbi:hypothetical protein SDC9_201105 [bioreactor metagenome]|uniref:Uncharacterized protein n=1 Tax=bioreactor metagenome TaxID=1076179 RepID=A0A645IQ35_9ZZZZ
MVRREQVKHLWQKLWLVKQECLFMQYLVLILYKFMQGSVPAEFVHYLKKQKNQEKV